MRESFEEYKSTIENNIIKFTYLYDGDVISSTDDSYSEIREYRHVSPSQIINCIDDIYHKSIKMMIDRSKEKIIPIRPYPLRHKPSNEADNIFYYIDNLKTNGFKPLYVFCSDNGRNLFGITREPKKSHPFPIYFDHISRYHSTNYDLYLSPLIIDDSNDQVEVYVTDKSIQSLVYSIQNMDYNVEKLENGSFKHTINYKLYDCDFTCYKLIIKNVSRIREDKINQLLNDN